MDCEIDGAINFNWAPEVDIDQLLGAIEAAADAYDPENWIWENCCDRKLPLPEEAWLRLKVLPKQESCALTSTDFRLLPDLEDDATLSCMRSGFGNIDSPKSESSLSTVVSGSLDSERNCSEDDQEQPMRLVRASRRLKRKRQRSVRRNLEASSCKRSTITGYVHQKGAPFPAESLNILREWIDQNLANPYPTKQRKENLAQRTGMSIRQIESWLGTARFKLGVQKRPKRWI